MKIIVYAIAMVFIYQICLWVTNAAPGSGRDNYEMNYITAENYRYLRKTPGVLLVGSSKPNFLNYDVLGSGIYHVGFGGQGCLVGLQILSKSKELPKVIVVEIGDTLQWSADNRYVEAATSPFEPGDLLSCLQHRYQPCAIALSVYQQMFPRQVPPEDYRQYLISVQQKELTQSFDEGRRKTVLANCEQAKTLMTDLRNRGAKVVMFDPPIEAAVANSQYNSAINKTVREFFAETDFPVLATPAGDWHTRDGTHLKPEDGTRYSIWLRQKLKKFL
jgi:hypothetical protein